MALDVLTDAEELALAWPMRPERPDVTVVFDTFLRSSFDQTCLVCGGWVAKGDRVRARFEVLKGGGGGIFYGCPPCCLAMSRACDPADTGGAAAIAARRGLASGAGALAEVCA